MLCRLLPILASFAALLCGGAGAQEEDGAFNKAAGVLALTPEQLKKKRQAGLQGTVTFADPRGTSFFLQDETAGILVTLPRGISCPAAGVSVTVNGTVRAAGRAPLLQADSLSVRGPGAWPTPQRTTARAVWQNEHYGQWVEIEGGIRDAAAMGPGVLHFSIASGGYTAYVALHGAPSDMVKPDWKDAVVKIRGVNSVENSIFLHVPAPSHFMVVKAGNPDVFSAPQTTAAQLLSGQLPQGRVRLRAVTAGSAYGEAAAFLDGSTGFLAHGPRPLTAGRRLVPSPLVNSLQPGDEVEMTGIPTLIHGQLNLLDTETRLLQKTAPPPPRASTLAELTDGKLNSRLVTVEARLMTVQTASEGRISKAVLILEDDGHLVEASLPLPEAQPLTSFPPDYLTEVTGVVFPPAGGKGPYRLLLRTAADAKSKHLAFTAVTQRALQIGGVVLAGGVGLLGWILALRRRVKKQTVEQRQTEAELRKALAAERDLSRLKSNFVSMVSHEFRTPLGIISVSSELMGRYRNRLKPEQVEEHLGAITNAAQRMAGMMENILVLSRVDTNRLEFNPAPLDLPGLCRRLVDEMHSITGRTCPIQFTAGPGTQIPARADESILRHILPNLLSNACKYSAPDSGVEFSLTREGKDAVFTITDHGIGISEDDQEKLFQSFHRGANVGQTPGTGLGLVIVKRCVDLHGGSITVTSTPGEGSTFTVKLPLFP